MPPITSRQSVPSGKVELLYVKSKVYLHPTKRAQDNIPGYLSISRPSTNGTNDELLLSFTPESMLVPSEKETFSQADLSLQTLSANVSGAIYVRTPLVSCLSSYAFSLPLGSLYLVQARPPRLNLWYGLMVLNTLHNVDKLPVIFFHDDESPSTQQAQSRQNKKFDPFASGSNLKFRTSDLPWGGDEFLDVVSRYAVLEKSTLERSTFLVNPSSADRLNFMPPTSGASLNKDTANTLGKTLNGMKWKVLETFASLSTLAKTTVTDIVDERNSALPLPVKHMLKKPEVASLANDFDGARIYLAKWAMSIQEEALKLNDQSTFILGDGEDDWGIVATRRKPVTRVEWDSFFDSSGRLRITDHEVREAIFHGSIDASVDQALRGEIWLFLLEVYPWDTSLAERSVVLESYKTSYQELKAKWEQDEVKQETDLFKDQIFRICKDVKRTDRNLVLFQSPKPENGEEFDDDDVLNVRHPHLLRLKNILLTYNEYNLNLGYVQGMNDLLSPVYLALYDLVALTFWMFAKYMDIMERNFLRDQLGIKQQIETLNELINLMLPQFYQHLIKCNANHLFFLFRMLLVWFKREFLLLDDVLSLWDVMFTRFYSSLYQLFIVLALLQKHESIMMDYLTEDYEILKYVNDLAMNEHDIDDILIRAEKLFLKFRRVVYQADRGDGKQEFLTVSPNLRNLLKRTIILQKEVPRPEGVLGG
ncbi:hypothetical protein BABINDRAFT_38280 [Babjeviella inositovora NRRL Y-12698]|uniref:Rab-GAP TBC domain-containing protein n=1 Tax=Babjeviella inositovora NRRL Y-12698 TaxID=984486 RepID=A0A1E3QNC1_9ASCO|nr:uncharacterized protein BABINDRAFT_38280 [Babjeviella inositovora NRRL Y-12698]ODQ79138.1 hypothetical protein BABINDRAFT_38280 [Babjeviella inositovora NRRL Y-12698]